VREGEGVGAKLVVLGVAFTVTFGLTPIVRRIAERRGAVVAPDERRVHTVPTATVGGVAMFVALLASLGVAWQLDGFDAVFESSSAPIGVLLAATIIFLVGLTDDLREVSAPARVAGMVLAGSVLVRFGVSILFLRIPFYDLVLLSPDLSALITVLWVVGMANAVNLVDGLDGLAAGIVAIASGSFFLYSEQLLDAGVIREDNVGPLIAIITLGICLGFLPHNFNPARIFMGDGGALLLGLEALGGDLGGQGAPPPPPHAPGPRPAAGGADPLGLDGRPQRAGALPGLHRSGRRRAPAGRRRAGLRPLRLLPPRHAQRERQRERRPAGRGPGFGSGGRRPLRSPGPDRRRLGDYLTGNLQP
jgi:UDP-N-acetylmuramyl pentapeptide phosphotransferase/UDP-N-acetylglucosamine-1-phosphate transferase